MRKKAERRNAWMAGFRHGYYGSKDPDTRRYKRKFSAAFQSGMRTASAAWNAALSA